MPTIVGVFREAEDSPGKVEDDAPILERTAAALTGRGFAVRLRAAAVGTPCWVKRGDVHAMERDDVVFAADRTALGAALARLRARGIVAAAVQAHVAGPVVKFYGVADGRFFRCYTDGADVPAPVE